MIEFYLRQKANRALRTSPTTQADNKKATTNQQTNKASLQLKCNLFNFKAKSKTDINLHKEAQNTANTAKSVKTNI